MAMPCHMIFISAILTPMRATCVQKMLMQAIFPNFANHAFAFSQHAKNIIVILMGGTTTEMAVFAISAVKALN
ncbi:hypothetical protein DK843_04815 [Chromobacterium phragmitis]|uniref:Uncharacterized protein n=1 Tax=Chromobacterium phragmitis TaxID=2202141 RepID=A0A344UEK2_9NEIS|nr:hypothetical protein DK843_04815 [Chromobacterium phragmitis]